MTDTATNSATLDERPVATDEAGSDFAQELTPSAVNLRRLIVLRAISLLGQLVMVSIATLLLGILLPIGPIAITFIGATLLNWFTWVRLRNARAVSDRELFVHLVLDVLLLTATLYFSGGSTNPFAMLYLIPVTLTAAALSWRFTWPMLLLAIGCYTLLLRFYVPLFHSHHGEPHVLDDFNLHVVGTWLSFILSGGLIAFFAVRMRETVRERDRLLARMREQHLHHERVLALGTLAAGAAHELGTPLATIAVLTKEMLRDQQDSERLITLREQVDRCKSILASLSAAVGQSRAEGGGAKALDEYLHELVERWRRLHPAIRVDLHMREDTRPPRIVTELTLEQSLVNVLNNAADVSPQIEVRVEWTASELSFDVLDRGPGLTIEAREHAGEPFFTTKEPGSGMGLGLFLARSTLERLGGSVVLDDREGGGTICRLRLPLKELQVTRT